MLETIYNITVLFSRRDMSVAEKIANLWGYYKIVTTHKISPHNLTFKFKGHTINALSFSDLRVILREVFVLGDYNVDLQTSAPVIFDCGANIGITSIYFKEQYPNAQITAFEPAEKTFEILKKNLSHLKDVTCVRAALGKQDGGTVQFWEMRGKPGGSTSIREVNEAKSSRRDFMQVEVPAAKLSSYISGLVDLMKMDIEGGEGLVLDELAESGKLTYIKEIVLEYHYNLANKHNKLSRIVDLLEGHGYTVVIFGTDLSASSELLKAKDGYHFMIRAYKNK